MKEALMNRIVMNILGVILVLVMASFLIGLALMSTR